MKSIESPCPKKTKNVSKHPSSLTICSWLNTCEAASFLRMSEGQVRNLASSGRIPHYKAAGRLRFERQELDSWIRQNQFGPRLNLKEESYD
jgi:excisionase family DNA binding protein